MLRAAAAVISIAAAALAARLIAGAGFVGYDTLYSLLWGGRAATGVPPELDVLLAPTPKPAVMALGGLLAPLGHDALPVTVVLAFGALGVLALFTFLLAARLAGPWAGVLASVLILTREPILSFGARAYVDVAYAALVVGAVLMEVQRPRAGRPVLLVLALAGLLRPEAWLFAGAYAVWLIRSTPLEGRHVLMPAALAAAAPLIWGVTDLVLAGDPLWSLTGTRDTAQRLERTTGLGEAALLAPRRLGEIVREPVLVGSVAGALLAAFAWGRRGRLVLAALAMAGVAFAGVALAGLPILGRYLLLPAVLLIVLAASAVTGWTRLPPGHRARRPAGALAALVVVLVAVLAPAQAMRLDGLQRTLRAQSHIVSDLHELADRGSLTVACGGIGVPNHRLVPYLAFWLDRAPRDILAGRAPRRGTYVLPATDRVARLFAIDVRDPARAGLRRPEGFRVHARTDTWTILARCPAMLEAKGAQHLSDQ